jgi:thiol-disulfide isomerase/thioredoxin
VRATLPRASSLALLIALACGSAIFGAQGVAATSAAAIVAPAVRSADPVSDIDGLFSLTLPDADARPFALERLRGKALIVNFWARWCVPCRSEIPQLVQLQRQHPGITVVGIALEDQPEAVRDFARAYDMDYLLLLAGQRGMSLLVALGNHAALLPYTLVVDRGGRVLDRRLGVMGHAEVDSALRLLRAQGAPVEPGRAPGVDAEPGARAREQQPRDARQ